MIQRLAATLVALLCAIVAAPPARAQQGQAVDIAGSRVLLMKPKSAGASIVLLPGGDGMIRTTEDGRLGRMKGNSLVRTADMFLKRNLNVLIIDANTDLRAAVEIWRPSSAR